MYRHWILGLLVAAFPGAAGAGAPCVFDGHRPDGHAPIGVMAEHVHHAGGMMVSYRYARMSMRGNRTGTRRRQADDVLRRFPVAPTSMDMEKHLFGFMFAPTHRLTLMAMVPVVRLDMQHRTRAGTRFTTRSHGLGDVTLTGLFKLWDENCQRVQLNAGIGIPTGSISRKDDTPMGRVRLPYPMQLGSGTFDFLPGLTYLGQRDDWSWGAQARAAVRMHRNRKGYRQGHGYAVTGWMARRFTGWLSGALRFEWSEWGDYHGADDDLNPLLVPTADPKRRGGERLDLLLSFNLLGHRALRGHRLAFEVGRPLYQRLDGPQLETDWRAVAGYQFAF